MFISYAVVNHQQKSFQRHYFYEVIKETKWKIYSTPHSNKEGSGGKVSSVIPWTILLKNTVFFPIPAKNACRFYLENKRLSGWLKDFTYIAKPAALDCSTLHFSLEFSVQPAVLLHPVETKNLLLWCLDCLQFWGNWAFSGKREDKQHTKMEKCVSLFTNYKDVPCMKSRGMEVVEVVLYYAKEFLYFFFHICFVQENLPEWSFLGNPFSAFERSKWIIFSLTEPFNGKETKMYAVLTNKHVNEVERKGHFYWNMFIATAFKSKQNKL